MSSTEPCELVRVFRGIVFLVLCAFCVFTSPDFARSQTPEQDETEGPQVELRVSTSTATFYLGEVIPLDLAFSSTTPKRYQINLARYDRSGRMDYEQFNVEPKDGTRDRYIFTSTPTQVSSEAV